MLKYYLSVLSFEYNKKLVSVTNYVPVVAQSPDFITAV